MDQRSPTPLWVNRVRDLTGALAIFAGLIHFAAAPHHFDEAFGFGAFMAIIGAAQVTAGFLLIRRPSWNVTPGTSLLTSFVLATYAVVHTVGLPFGPYPGEAHAPHGIDLISKTTELALLLLLLVESKASRREVRFRDIVPRYLGVRWREVSPVRRYRLAALAPVALGTFALLTLGANWASSDSRETMQLTDEPGNWFRSEATGGQGQSRISPAAVVRETDAEVQGWIAQLTACQKDPSPAACVPAGPGR